MRRMSQFVAKMEMHTMQLYCCQKNKQTWIPVHWVVHSEGFLAHSELSHVLQEMLKL